MWQPPVNPVQTHTPFTWSLPGVAMGQEVRQQPQTLPLTSVTISGPTALDLGGPPVRTGTPESLPPGIIF